MATIDDDRDPAGVSATPSRPRAVRVVVAIPVRLYDGHQMVPGELQNLSTGGAFVAVEPPIPTGTGLSFWAPLPGGPPLLLRGHVRWTRSLGGPQGEAVGIGIQLFEPDFATTSRLEEVVRAASG